MVMIVASDDRLCGNPSPRINGGRFVLRVGSISERCPERRRTFPPAAQRGVGEAASLEYVRSSW